MEGLPVPPLAALRPEHLPAGRAAGGMASERRWQGAFPVPDMGGRGGMSARWSQVVDVPSAPARPNGPCRPAGAAPHPVLRPRRPRRPGRGASFPAVTGNSVTPTAGSRMPAGSTPKDQTMTPDPAQAGRRPGRRRRRRGAGHRPDSRSATARQCLYATRPRIHPVKEIKPRDHARYPDLPP
jgi:hypothetical protein